MRRTAQLLAVLAGLMVLAACGSSHHGVSTSARGTPVGAAVTGAHGTVAALTGVPDPAVSVTGTGGTFAISTNGSGTTR
jgi:hypothetical protein